MSTKNELLEDMGKRIRIERVRLSLRVLKVCNHLDIHPNTYRNYETGKRDIHASKLLLLSGLGFDIAYIITGLKKSDIDSHATVVNKTKKSNRLIKEADGTGDSEGVVNELIEGMRTIEDTLLRVGAVSGDDYTYADLASFAIQLKNT